MARDLKNKVAVITGGAGGIGSAIADNFLRSGAKTVLILDVSEKRGNEVANKLNANYGSNKAVFIKCDITKDLEDVSKKIISTYRTIDVLVNCAGVVDELNTKRTININLQALVDWSLKFCEHMRTDKKGKGGTIINISSIYGTRCDEHLPIYQASKFAVTGFTGSLGHVHNFNRSGVRVVAICPGFVETPIVSDPATFDESLKDDFTAFMKTQLWQKPDAVGKAAVEIFEKASSGQAWVIEGGKLSEFMFSK